MGFSTIPLPKVVADVGPGGGLVTAMRGGNALADEMMQERIRGIQAQYAPITTQAEAASKLAYANLMGPQFLAKLLGHQDILANIPDPQKRQALQMLYQAGTGQGTGNALVNPQNQQGMLPPPQNQPFSLSGFLANKLHNIFTSPQPNQQQPQPRNVFSEGYQPEPVQQQQYPDTSAPIPDAEVGRASEAWMNSPEAQAQAKKEGMYTIPPKDQLLSWYRNQGNQQQAPSTGTPSQPQYPGSITGQQPTFAENVGAYGGTVEEGKESGKIRANDIKELNDIVFNAETKQATLDDINSMIGSPEIREIRQLPLAGRHEMGFYAKEGTPAQQQLVGRLYAQMGNIIKDSSRDFAGQFRKGEQQLLSGMKPNDSDTVDAMIGKAESLSVMNKMLMERARLTSRYMSQYHINKLQAQEEADKQINGPEIRREVHDRLNPTKTIRNKKTGEIITVPVKDAREKYGVQFNV